jgi:hypothetical protein
LCFSKRRFIQDSQPFLSEGEGVEYEYVTPASKADRHIVRRYLPTQ